MALARRARRVTLGPLQSKGQERARAHRAMVAAGRRDNPELSDYARARLDPFYGVAIVADDPYAPDGYVGDGWDDSPPADCPYRIGKRSPRRCVRPNGHDGGHDPAPVAPPVSIGAYEADRAERGLPVSAPDPQPWPTQRPTCERCGQTFRATGNGAEWHRINRPDCASVAPRLAVAS